MRRAKRPWSRVSSRAGRDFGVPQDLDPPGSTWPQGGARLLDRTTDASSVSFDDQLKALKGTDAGVLKEVRRSAVDALVPTASTLCQKVNPGMPGTPGVPGAEVIPSFDEIWSRVDADAQVALCQKFWPAFVANRGTTVGLEVHVHKGKQTDEEAVLTLTAADGTSQTFQGRCKAQAPGIAGFVPPEVANMSTLWLARQSALLVHRQTVERRVETMTQGLAALEEQRKHLLEQMGPGGLAQITANYIMLRTDLLTEAWNDLVGMRAAFLDQLVAGGWLAKP